MTTPIAAATNPQRIAVSQGGGSFQMLRLRAVAGFDAFQNRALQMLQR